MTEVHASSVTILGEKGTEREKISPQLIVNVKAVGKGVN